MKLLVFAVFLFVVSSFAQQQCGDTQCAEGECCVVYMFFTRRCQKLATERQLCWRRNENASTYLWICPCETGLLCHMNRCRSDRNRVRQHLLLLLRAEDRHHPNNRNYD
uniref:U29-Hexatoxin-Hf1c_1 n=1 Tax=Hadronyche formidabilis TaxID=426499 RepID=A0A4Q8K8A5_HADFO